MASSLRFGLVSENAYFNKVDQLLLENLREALELQEEARRCAEESRVLDRDHRSNRSRTEELAIASVE